MPSASGFAFGPYQLDVRAKRLVRTGEDGARIPLSELHFDLLHLFVSRPGDLLTKDVLIQAAWRDVAVGENNIEQAISRLRRLLDAGDRDRYIHTESGRGYRFTESVTRVGVGHTDAELDALLAPHRALIDGRAALETLELSEIARARKTFDALLVSHGDQPAVHVGFANACVLQFDATRAERAPDTEALRLAASHSREACRLDPNYGEAWAALGFVLERTGARVDALAALRRSVTIEPDNWLHWLRLSSVGWGEERLRAARRTLELMPDCPPARLLAATVFVARDALDLAERELDAGLAAMPDAEGRTAPVRFSIVGLHWLKALLCLARGVPDEDDHGVERHAAEAVALLEKELALDAGRHMYAREMAANAWYAMGAVRWRRRDVAGAREAFEHAVARVPAHPMARAGLELVAGGRVSPFPSDQGANGPVEQGVIGPPAANRHPPLPAATPAAASVDTAIARAVAPFADIPAAVRLVADALAAAPPGNAGWLIPIEPLLGVRRDHATWAPVLAALRTRAA